MFPVFWLWPLLEAVPVYGVILALSMLVYAYVMRGMRCPVEIGAEEILHSIGKVVQVAAKDTHVRVHREMWRAVSAEKLKPARRSGRDHRHRWVKASSPQACRFICAAERGGLARAGA
jgi:membrane protein implicated in regulation of membrane protease activity